MLILHYCASLSLYTSQVSVNSLVGALEGLGIFGETHGVEAVVDVDAGAGDAGREGGAEERRGLANLHGGEGLFGEGALTPVMPKCRRG